MRKLAVVATVLFTLSIASSVLAAGYGAAGCGFGGMLIKENKILHQIGAWFLNGILGNQTFGITSGTSECGGMKGVMADQDQERFVESNYQALAKEMAAGEGENLNTLAGLLGCPAEKTGGFATYAQKNYHSLFKGDETTPSETLAALKKGLSEEPVFSSSCSRI